MMRRPYLLIATGLALSVFTTGCGSDSVQTAGTSPLSTLTTSPAPAEDAASDDPDAEFHEALMEWLRSDYVKKLDPKKLRRGDLNFDGPIAPPAIEPVTEQADLVVSGKVTELRFVPEGTLTTFRVDRTAKGGAKEEVLVMQTGYVWPEGTTLDDLGEAALLEDPELSFLFKNDRAVLFLREVDSLEPLKTEFLGDSLGDAQIYRILRQSGQYKSENGKLRPEKTNSNKQYSGQSEEELMDDVDSYADSPGESQE